MPAVEGKKNLQLHRAFSSPRAFQSTCSDYPPLKCHHLCGGTEELFNTTLQSARPGAWLNGGLYAQQMLSLSWMLFGGFHQLAFGLQINGHIKGDTGWPCG